MNRYVDIPEVLSLESLSSNHPHFRIRTASGKVFFLESEKNCYAGAMYGAEIVRVDESCALCMNQRLVATLAKLYWDAQRKKCEVTEFLGRNVDIPLMEEKAAAKYLAKMADRRYPYELYRRLKNAEWIDENCQPTREPEWVSRWRSEERARLSGEIIEHLASVTDIIENGFCDGCRGMGGSCMGCCLEDCGSEMVGALVKRATALMEHMPHRGHAQAIEKAKAYVAARREVWFGRTPDIEFVTGSVLDVKSLDVEGLAVFLPAGLTAFRWQAKDFVVGKARRIRVESGLEFLECGHSETGRLSRMVYDPNRQNRTYGKYEIDELLDVAFAYFESSGIRSVAVNGLRTSGDGAQDTVSAVKRWCARNGHTTIRRICLVDKRGGFERFNKG